MDLDKNYRVNSLLEFYYPLLTKKQQEYMRCYFIDDYSLGEISQNFKVSRQAVYDNLRRTVSILEEYENELHLHKYFVARNRLIDKIQSYTKRKYPKDRHVSSMIKELEHLEDK
ncbi:MAG: putative DNA-binding protein [Acetilactobacillus jinshanensis]